MKTLRNFLSAACGLGLLAAVVAPAIPASVPLLSGPLDPGNMLGTLNTLIQSLNANVGGLLNAQTAAVATGTGTAEQILQQYTMPANTLTAAGQSIRVSCWGTTGATANVKTRTLYIGANSFSTAAEAANAQPWQMSMVLMRTGAATQAVFGKGLAGTAGVTPLDYVAAGTNDLTAGVLIKCTATDGTSAAADVTANGLITELIK